MEFAHVLSAFYFEPWNLRPDVHANFGRVLQAILAGQPAPTTIQKRPARLLSAARTGRPIVGPVDDFGRPLVRPLAIEGSHARFGFIMRNLRIYPNKFAHVLSTFLFRAVDFAPRYSRETSGRALQSILASQGPTDDHSAELYEDPYLH